MGALGNMTRSAQRRIVLESGARSLGPALALAGGAALGVVGADRFFGWGWSWGVVLGVCTGAALLGLAVWVFSRRPSPLGAAVRADGALGLKGVVAGGAELARVPTRDAFVALALDQAEHAAANADVRKAVPVTIKPSLWWGCAALVAAASAGIWVPEIGRDRARARERLAAAETERREELAGAVKQVVRDRPIRPEENTSLRETKALKDLEAIEKELRAGTTTAAEAGAEAAAAMSTLADGADREAREAQAADSALRKQLSGLSGGAGATDPLRDALRRGDLAEAASKAEQLLKTAGSMTEEEREKAAKDLEALAKELAQSPKASGSAQAGEDSEKRRLEEELAAKGVDENVGDASQPTDPERIEKELKRKGVDERDAKSLSERMAEENSKARAQEQAERDREALKDAMEKTARDVRTGESKQDGSKPSEKNDSKGSSEKKDGKDAARSESKDPSDKPGGSEKQGEKSSPKGDPQGKPGEATKPGDQKDGQKPDGSKEPGNKEQGNKESENKGQENKEQGAREGGEKKPDAPPQGKPTSMEGAKKEPGEEKVEGTKERRDAQRNGKGETPKLDAQEGEQKPGGESPKEGLGDALKRMGQRKQQAQEQQRRAEDLRERAREMAQDAGGPAPAPKTPQSGAGKQDGGADQPEGKAGSKPGSQPGAQRETRPDGGAFRTSPLDLRKPGEDDPANSRVTPAGEGDGSPVDESSLPVASPSERAAAGARRAEQAIGDRAFPKRYDGTVRRFFQKVGKNAPSAPAPPVPLAPDPKSEPK